MLILCICGDLQEVKESKRRNKSGLRAAGVEEMSDSPKSKGVQLSITEFYRSAKVDFHEKPGEDSAENSETTQGRETSTEKRKASSSKLSKSVRRRLLFG